MDNSSEHEAAEGDVDHCLRDVDPLLIIADEPFPARHPTEGALDDPYVDGPSLQRACTCFDRIVICPHRVGRLVC